jgi:hypothetical protein
MWRLVGVGWFAGVAGSHFLSERQKVTKKRVAYAAGNQFHGAGGSSVVLAVWA